MAPVISVVNHKGGAAKTTTAVNLAAALSEEGARILVVDLDPQASASLWLGARATGEEFLEATLSGSGFDELVQGTGAGVDLIPCGPAFASFEKIAANKPGAESLLRKTLEQLADRWDYVFLDCPPSLNLTCVNALVASTLAIVPVAAQVLSLEPLARLIDTMGQIRDRFNPGLLLNGIFASRVDHRTAHGPEILRLLREQFGDTIYDASIRENVSVAEAAGFNKSITQYAPSSNGADDYRALAREFQKRIKTQLAEEKA